ncbi:MAG: hypothetical protein HQK65_00565 [Desulfamplus sp.]|nr:hypothetical protein [Desulfamplus sp.]
MNPIKIIAETILAGGALYFPQLALAQPLLSSILDKAPDSIALKSILKSIVDRGGDLSNPKKSLAEHGHVLENEIKAYYCEVLDEINKPTEKINITNAGFQEIFKSILTANKIDVNTIQRGKTVVQKSNISANNEVNITTQTGGHTLVTESIIGKNGGMKMDIPKNWIVNQPSGWVQQYHDDGSYSIGTIGTPDSDFTIGTRGNPDDDFKIVSEKSKKK